MLDTIRSSSFLRNFMWFLHFPPLKLVYLKNFYYLCARFRAVNKNMENNQTQNQDTDARILLRYISSCADIHNPVPPMLVLRVAIHLLENFRENLDNARTTWEYIDEAQAIIQKTTGLNYTRRSPGYQVVAAMYVMLRADGLKTIQEEALANDIALVLQDRAKKNFNFNQQAVEQAIQDIQQYKQTAPPTINPLELFAELAEGKNFAQVDWKVALNEVVKYQHLFGKTFPYYLLLHTFVHTIPYPTKRVDVLGYLQDAAEKYLPEVEAKEFVKDADYINHIYMRLNGLLWKGPAPKVWDDAPDMDELTLFVGDIHPEELVAVAQSIYDSREIVGQRIGMVQHILRHQKYIGQLLTTSSYDFCKCLYLAHGYRMLMMSGKEDFRDLPTIDNLDCEFRNACFDVYIDLRVKQILQELKRNNRRLYPAKEKEAYEELIKQLLAEYTQLEQAAPIIIPNFMARDSLLTAMDFLSQYAQDKQKTCDKPAVPTDTKQVIIQTPQVNIDRNYGQINSIENSDVSYNP